MATIIFADTTLRYCGPDFEKRPLGGTESSVIQCARELARRGHSVTVYSNCDASVMDHGVSWLPLENATPPETCDLYIACHQPHLFGFVRRPRRRAVWVLWPVSQLKHYKKIWRMWLHRPVPILISDYQAQTYSPFLPPTGPKIILPHGLPADVRGHKPLPAAPPRRAIFASNPQRNLRGLVEIWAESILPRVPDAVLDVYGVNDIKSDEDAWQKWEGTVLPPGMSAQVKASVRLHAPLSRAGLITAMRESRVLLYLGHKSEAFCLAVAEAQALGVPAVVAPVTVLPERVKDGVTGFVRANPDEFAKCATGLLTDDNLWRRQHEASLLHQQGITWAEHARRLESAFISTDHPSGTAPPATPHR